MSLEVLNPVAGTVVPLEEVADPVFADAIVGPGIAVDPVRAGEISVVAPVAGTIAKLHPHAFVIVTEEGRGVLVHLGLDTVQLNGEGFTLQAEEKETVEAGRVLLTWSPAEIEAGGRSPVCPVIALEGKAEDLTLAVFDGEAVDPTQHLFTWA